MSLGNSSFEKDYYSYGLVKSFEPYDVLSYKALKEEVTNSKDLRYFEQNDSISFATLEPDKCTLQLYFHFQNQIIICHATVFPEELIIKTDKLVYIEGDTISVKITPSNASAMLKYDNESVQAIGDYNFTASYPGGRIDAFSAGQEAYAVFSVQKRGRYSVVLGLAVFSGLNYVVYFLIRRYWGFWI